MQGLGISTNSQNPEAAADFLGFLTSPERLQAFWDATGWIPSHSNFDISVIQDPSVKSLWENWGQVANISNVTNLMPGQFYEQAAIPTAQQIVQGTMSGEEAGNLAAQVSAGMARFNPDLVELPEVGEGPVRHLVQHRNPAGVASSGRGSFHLPAHEAR